MKAIVAAAAVVVVVQYGGGGGDDMILHLHVPECFMASCCFNHSLWELNS